MIKETKYSNKPWARDVCSYVLGRGGERGVWCGVWYLIPGQRGELEFVLLIVQCSEILTN